MSDPKKEVYYCAIDIEKSRAELGTGVIAVAFVFTDENGVVLEKACFSKSFNDSDFDESTGRFWSNHQDVLVRISENAKTSPLVWRDVIEFVHSLETKYGPFGRKFANEREFRWICDNPAYDIGQINLMMHLEDKKNPPLAEMFTEYVPTSDPTEQYRTLLDDEKEFVDSQLKSPHSHYPTEDALRDIEMYVAIQKVLEARKLKKRSRRSVSPGLLTQE